MAHDRPPPAEAFAAAAEAYHASRTNLATVTARAQLADPNLRNDVFGFSTVCHLLSHLDRNTTVGLAAAAITQLLQKTTTP